MMLHGPRSQVSRRGLLTQLASCSLVLQEKLGFSQNALRTLAIACVFNTSAILVVRCPTTRTIRAMYRSVGLGRRSVGWALAGLCVRLQHLRPPRGA